LGFPLFPKVLIHPAQKGELETGETDELTLTGLTGLLSPSGLPQLEAEDPD